MTTNKKQFAIELERPKGATDKTIKKYIETAVSTECGCRNPEEDPMYHLNRKSIKIMQIVKRSRIACLPTYEQWFDKNRSRLIDASPQDAALMMYNDLLTILK